ncbi:MAG: LSM domain-containing protein [Candidatus Geothermarchaeota archaeon]
MSVNIKKNMQTDKKNVRTPFSVIYKQINSEISVYLKTGEIYTGTLKKVDNYMNLLLENTVEEIGGKQIRYGRALIRGNNILFIKVNKDRL